MDDQLHLADHAQPAGATPAFLTDDELDRRLSQIAHGLEHFAALLPSMISEVARLRGMLAPRAVGE